MASEAHTKAFILVKGLLLGIGQVGWGIGRLCGGSPKPYLTTNKGEFIDALGGKCSISRNEHHILRELARTLPSQ